MPEPLVIWRLTDGKPGHMQQTLGLVRALATITPCDVIDMDLTAQPVGFRDFLLGRFMPGIAKTKPTFIVGAGHATHWGLLAARKVAGGRAVALMKPSLPVFLFDFVVVPEHDGLSGSERVINTVGVLNPMRPAEKKPESLLVLIGGPSKHVQWDDGVVLAQVEQVVASIKPGVAWRITDSRRTPDALRETLQRKYGERFQPFSQCPPGWLAERLAVTESVWVSEDSVSMVYEALTAGCRVGLLRLPAAGRTSSRVLAGMQRLLDRGWVASVTDDNELPLPPRFDEAGRVAALLLERAGSGA